jgi:hypothetical protein
MAWTISAQQQTAESYKQKTRTFHSAEEFARLTAGKVQLQRQLDAQQHAALRQTAVRWPSIDFTVIGIESPSVTWVGTRRARFASRTRPAVECCRSSLAARRSRDGHRPTAARRG